MKLNIKKFQYKKTVAGLEILLDPGKRRIIKTSLVLLFQVTKQLTTHLKAECNYVFTTSIY
jgi:hypothetical protein